MPIQKGGESMEQKGSAYFVEKPRRLDDLVLPYAVTQKQRFEIVRTVVLSGIDYENFITDMRADRQFIENNASSCSMGETWKCLFIRRCSLKNGVLVMPTGACFVGWAALWDG